MLYSGGSECTNYTTTGVYYSQLVVISWCLFSQYYSNLCTTSTNNGRGGVDGVLVDGSSTLTYHFYLVLLYYVLQYHMLVLSCYYVLLSFSLVYVLYGILEQHRQCCIVRVLVH